MMQRNSINSCLGLFLVFLLGGLMACAPKPQKLEDAALKYKIGKKLYFNGDFPQAIASLEDAAKLDSKNAEIQHFLGLVYFEKKLYNKAETHFLKSVRLDKSFAEAHNHLCALYGVKNEYTKALSHCDSALKSILYPTPERAHYNKGQIYEKMRDSSLATQAYQEAISRNEKFVPALKRLAELGHKANDLISAEKYYIRIAQVCAGDESEGWGGLCALSNYELAQMYIRLRSFNRAQNSLRQCIENSEAGSDIYLKCNAAYARIR